MFLQALKVRLLNCKDVKVLSSKLLLLKKKYIKNFKAENNKILETFYFNNLI